MNTKLLWIEKYAPYKKNDKDFKIFLKLSTILMLGSCAQ